MRLSYKLEFLEVYYERKIQIKEERITAEEYIDFLKRTDLGSQYPKERFEERIKKLVKNVSVSLVARNENKNAGYKPCVVLSSPPGLFKASVVFHYQIKYKVISGTFAVKHSSCYYFAVFGFAYIPQIVAFLGKYAVALFFTVKAVFVFRDFVVP